MRCIGYPVLVLQGPSGGEIVEAPVAKGASGNDNSDHNPYPNSSLHLDIDMNLVLLSNQCERVRALTALLDKEEVMCAKILVSCLIPLFVAGCSSSPSQPQSQPNHPGLSNLSEARGTPVRCHVDAVFDWDQYLWFGTVTGDISGQVIFTPIGTGKQGQQEPGWAYHFAETFVIQDDQDNLLVAGNVRGLIPGLYPWDTPVNVMARGRVTDAAEEWSHLIGCTVHQIGQYTDGPPTTAQIELRIN